MNDKVVFNAMLKPLQRDKQLIHDNKLGKDGEIANILICSLSQS